jgi:predicted transcriptional regulator
MADEMLTAKKVAEKLGVSAGKVTKYIKEQGIEPDQKKGPCCYYGPKTVKQIEKGVK